jgi:ComF family protein
VSAIAGLLAPLRCVGCGVEGTDELCGSCAQDVRVLTPPWCDRCGTPGRTHSSGRCARCEPFDAFDCARSLVVFAEPARRLTLQLKRKGRRGLAASIGELLALLARRERLAGRDTVVTWVPGGRASRRHGFDHAAQIAAALARALDVRAERVVVRARDGPRQADVPLAKRRENVAGRFAAARAPRRVLLVDDVYTTGSTAQACASVLRAAGAQRVDVVTWARTPRLRP